MKHIDYPVYIMDETKEEDIINYTNHCEEIIQSRRAIMCDNADYFDTNAFVAIPSGITTSDWYLCMFKYYIVNKDLSLERFCAIVKPF